MFLVLGWLPTPPPIMKHDLRVGADKETMPGLGYVSVVEEAKFCVAEYGLVG